MSTTGWHYAPILLALAGHCAPILLALAGHCAPILLALAGHCAPILLALAGHCAPILLAFPIREFCRSPLISQHRTLSAARGLVPPQPARVRQVDFPVAECAHLLLHAWHRTSFGSLRSGVRQHL